MSQLTEILERLKYQLTVLKRPAANRFRLGLALDSIEIKLHNFGFPLQISKEAYELYQWADGIDEYRKYAPLYPGVRFPSLQESLKFYL